MKRSEQIGELAAALAKAQAAITGAGKDKFNPAPVMPLTTWEAAFPLPSISK